MVLKRGEDSNKTNGVCKLSITDDFTIYAIKELKNELDKKIELYQSFELDLSAVEEIDSAGVQLLLALRIELLSKSKELKISESNEIVTKLLDSYDLVDFFNGSEPA